jgi:hypothetical protein
VADPDIDRALCTADDDIVPSSGFAEAVMATIEREAAAPPPIRFPWMRALPGILAAIISLLVFIRTAIPTIETMGQQGAAPAEQQAIDLGSILVSSSEPAGIALSLFLTAALIVMAMRLVRQP